MASTVTVKLPTGGTYQQPTGLFIDNKFVAANSGRSFESINPATEKPICAVQEADSTDIDLAVAAARRAFKHGSPWRKMTPGKRGQLINKLADLMDAATDQLASIEALDNGKAKSMAIGDVKSSVACLRYYAGWADKVLGQTIDTDDDRLAFTLHEPIGVCGQIIPWNFPLMMLAWKIAPALACGCTVVLKSAEQTPLSALVVGELVVKAGIPPGVLNIVSGFGNVAGAALAEHPNVDKVAFTGSTATGRSILKAAANSNLKKVTLELGGKSPQIVFDDADVDETVKWAVNGIFSNHGQNCIAGSRLYIQAGIYDEFLDKFIARAREIQVGDPFAAKTLQGPQVSQKQFNTIMSYIQSARDEGATVALGGEREGKVGYFVRPTVITGVSKKNRVMREEIFGPVVSVAKFSDPEEVIEMANDTTYGLGSGIYSQNIKRALKVARRIESGTVYVNCYNMTHHQVPFGGYKTSGIGRELGSYALENYCQVKAVHVNLSMAPPKAKL